MEITENCHCDVVATFTPGIWIVVDILVSHLLKLLKHQSITLLAIYCQDPTTRLETNGDGELVPQRRERYVFRPILIRILEAYFAESPFPDTQKRAEISQTCNNALQAEKKGKFFNWNSPVKYKVS